MAKARIPASGGPLLLTSVRERGGGVGFQLDVYRRKGPHMARTVREQQDKRREEKLKQVQEQVDDGSLVIRRMTKEERKDNPPKPRPKDKRQGR